MQCRAESPHLRGRVGQANRRQQLISRAHVLAVLACKRRGGAKEAAAWLW